MGCFFGCFRTRDTQNSRLNHVSDSNPSKSTVVVASQKLSSLLHSDENEEVPCKGKDCHHTTGSSEFETDLKGLQDEAKFLKACGTLLQTPAEIRKASKRFEGSPPYNRNAETSKFHSWIPNTSIKKLHMDEQSDHLPTPVKLCEDWEMVSCSSVNTPNSCVSDARDSEKIITTSRERYGATNVHANQTGEVASSVTSVYSSVSNSHYKNKVHFDYESSTPFLSSDMVMEHSKKIILTDNERVSKPSPYPTPLKLNDEMQTPGTVLPANMQNLASGKNARIRSQYVNSVLNPVENASQWKKMKEGDSNSHQPSSQDGESLDDPDNDISAFEMRERENPEGKELGVEASLSAWLKPKLSNQDEKSQQLRPILETKPHFGRTPTDRPILGTVGTHWNEEDISNVSLKWWDGNGIPNSTNKYKEDQKVSWHATPFEERLEKALSEEELISQRNRKHNGAHLNFDANVECDKAISQMKSAISC